MSCTALILRDEPAWLLAHVRQLVDRQEARFADPWSIDDAPEGYVETQAKAIVGLELAIDRVEGKAKLSQNRSEDDGAGVVAGLRAEGAGREARMADQVEGLVRH